MNEHPVKLPELRIGIVPHLLGNHGRLALAQQDRPKLDAVAEHETKGPREGVEAAEGGEFIEQEVDAAGRAGDPARSWIAS